jgi:hypothetical protein
LVELYNDIEKAFGKAIEKSMNDRTKNDGVFKFTFTGVDVLPKQADEARRKS